MLVAEVPNDEGSLKGPRPLEGGVAFGESRGTALRRAFREETGLDVDIVGAPLVMENLFEHNGVCGHEVIFLAEERLPDGAFAGQTRIDVRENDGTACVARWVPLADLDGDPPPLFPTGLKSRLLTRS